MNVPKKYLHQRVDKYLEAEKPTTIVLLSGGVDSLVLLVDEQLHTNHTCVALTIDYGQLHKVEISAARKIADKYKIKHLIATADLSFMASPLLARKMPMVESLEPELDIAPTLETLREPEYWTVPARNMIFVSMATALAEVLPAHRIVLGCTAEDAKYKDCSMAFLKAASVMAAWATEAQPTIFAPFNDRRKQWIVSHGKELGVDFTHTVTCYQPMVEGKVEQTVIACGVCPACITRQTAFTRAGVDDPANYQVEY